LEYFCANFGQRLPYVSENGAALYNSDMLLSEGFSESGGPKILGWPVSELMAIWTGNIPNQLSDQCLFLDETEQDNQSKYLGLNGDALGRAMKRNYSRPFFFKGSDDEFSALISEVKRLDLNVLRGGRICNLSGPHDKADSISIIRDLADAQGGELVIVALGDGDNDLNMLESADIACVVPRKNQPPLGIDVNNTCRKVIHASRTAPHGWQEAVEMAIKFLKTEYRYSYG
jgi:predicted mannosyl-3-phosphoglycerate phosphatase (HAD superfamily)